MFNANVVITNQLLSEIADQLPQLDCLPEWEGMTGGFDPLVLGSAENLPELTERQIYQTIDSQGRIVFIVLFDGAYHVAMQAVVKPGRCQLFLKGSENLHELFETAQRSELYPQVHQGEMSFTGLVEMFAFFGPEAVEEFLLEYARTTVHTETVEQVDVTLVHPTGVYSTEEQPAPAAEVPAEDTAVLYSAAKPKGGLGSAVAVGVAAAAGIGLICWGLSKLIDTAVEAA